MTLACQGTWGLSYYVAAATVVGDGKLTESDLGLQRYLEFILSYHVVAAIVVDDGWRKVTLACQGTWSLSYYVVAATVVDDGK